MELLKLSTDWAKAEVLSAKVVFLFSIIVLMAAFGFWFLGKTAMARAFIWPMLISGVFLIAVSAGLYRANKPRIEQFEQAFRKNSQEFVHQELLRTAQSQKELTTIFKVLPILLIVAGIIILFFSSPVWRAVAISLGLLATFLMAVDSNTATRNSMYHEQLKNFRNE